MALYLLIQLLISKSDAIQALLGVSYDAYLIGWGSTWGLILHAPITISLYDRVFNFHRVCYLKISKINILTAYNLR